MTRTLEEKITAVLTRLEQAKEIEADLLVQKELELLHSLLTSEQKVLALAERKKNTLDSLLDMHLQKWITSKGVRAWIRYRRFRRTCQQKLICAGEIYLMRENIENLLDICEEKLANRQCVPTD